jgi:hypothetical protein
VLLSCRFVEGILAGVKQHRQAPEKIFLRNRSRERLRKLSLGQFFLGKVQFLPKKEEE